ncbi:ring canal kelch homolog isoform X2 [Metopolophium dirhodum]|uniref:ring canal kelch homolog isoform X2 n=1 Tax=Metopolophium dirhodum TaxID=44670 RepID=UPI0029902493|nr:ring canal kelch homolog isoform X2 [Metopolophium dirhodum]
MSVKEMGSVRHVIPWTNGQKQVLKPIGCDPKIYVNSCHTHSLFEVLQCLRREEVFCDMKLETDDGIIVSVHKVVLVSASPYFHAMFTSFSEGDKDFVHLREFDSNILQLLIDYIYTGKIMVTEQNVMVLLQAANLLQLDFVKGVCTEFLQIQLNPSNCLGIKEFADFFNCMELSSSSEEYIKKNFLKVVEADEFLFLSSDQVINLISRDDINVPFEEKIFECVINWVKNDLDCRCDTLPKLMEHVRLSLAPQEYLSIKIFEEPLIKNSSKCKDFLIEALNFHILKNNRRITIPQTIRNSPRQTGQKFLLSIWDSMSSIYEYYISWYDPATKLMHKTIRINSGSRTIGLIKEHLIFSISTTQNIYPMEMLDLSSQSLQWTPTVSLLVDRIFFKVCVLDDRIYAVGGVVNRSPTNSVEVFDASIQEWRLISPMFTEREDHGVGVLNNLIYVVGGYNRQSVLKSVECYDPSLDIWTSVTQMSTSRRWVGVGVLDGIMYAIGGEHNENNRSYFLNSVEAYSPISKVWSFIANMHNCRISPSVVTYNGLLYVMGGFSGVKFLDSVEIYDPKTNTWTIEPFPTNEEMINGAVVVNMPSHLRAD